MKSIRLSLIVYFLVLIALALGGVTTLVYQTASTTLQDKQASTEDLLWTQFQTQQQELRASLDRRLLRQALLLASKARTVPVPYETLFPVMASGMGTTGAGALVTPLWIVEPYAGSLNFRVRTRHGFDIHIAAADDYLPIDDDQPQEFFQTFRQRGTPVQRSASLKDHWLTLSDETRQNAEVLREEFDDLELNGEKLRRVTLKAHVTGSRTYPWRFFPFNPNPKHKGSRPTVATASTPKPPPPPQPPIDQTAPAFFIQYAGETTLVEEQIRQFEVERDARLAGVQEDTRLTLAYLRRRFFWISVLTFLGIVAGGYVLLRLGLKPLARLSEAVSKVSEKNFELQVDVEKLPSELRPIADRLSQTLDQLQKAFAHEKQAAADLSHELRTPLAAIMTTLDVALRKKRTPEEYREILEECRLSGKHMSHLVERLMALARLDAGVEPLSLEAVDVGDLAHQCADMVRPLVTEQGLTLDTQLDESIHAVTDAGKLREILLNLLHNAIAYNKPRGSITLAVESVRGRVRVEVRDTGIGIAPEARAHLFERFFRADPSRHADTPHCGLGLAIVKSYVDLLGGTLEVDSTPAGSTFRLELPRGAEEPSTTTERATAMQT